MLWVICSAFISISSKIFLFLAFQVNQRTAARSITLNQSYTVAGSDLVHHFRNKEEKLLTLSSKSIIWHNVFQTYCIVSDSKKKCGMLSTEGLVIQQTHLETICIVSRLIFVSVGRALCINLHKKTEILVGKYLFQINFSKIILLPLLLTKFQA